MKQVQEQQEQVDTEQPVEEKPDILSLNVWQAKDWMDEQLAGIEDPQQAMDWLAQRAEEETSGKGRKGVLAAIQERGKALGRLVAQVQPVEVEQEPVEEVVVEEVELVETIDQMEEQGTVQEPQDGPLEPSTDQAVQEEQDAAAIYQAARQEAERAIQGKKRVATQERGEGLTWVCSCCEQEKESGEYGQQASGKWRGRCKACRSDAARKANETRRVGQPDRPVKLPKAKQSKVAELAEKLQRKVKRLQEQLASAEQELAELATVEQPVEQSEPVEQVQEQQEEVA